MDLSLHVGSVFGEVKNGRGRSRYSGTGTFCHQPDKLILRDSQATFLTVSSCLRQFPAAQVGRTEGSCAPRVCRASAGPVSRKHSCLELLLPGNHGAPAAMRQ